MRRTRLDMAFSRIEQGSGLGYLAGDPPASSDADAADGRAKVMNQPARVRVIALDRRSLQPVRATYSTAAGRWRIGGLNPMAPHMVLGLDDTGQYNAAVQDWVLPAVEAVVAGVSLRGRAAWSLFSGVATTMYYTLQNADGAVDFTISAGSLPAGLTQSIENGFLKISGDVATPGAYAFTVKGDDSAGNSAALQVTVTVAKAGYSYFRLNITDNNGSTSYVAIPEIQVRSVTGGPDRCVGGTASASSFANPDNAPALAFNDVLSDKWTSNSRPTVGTPEWIQYQFAAAIDIVEVAIAGGISGQLSFSPKDFEIQASRDGRTFDVLRSVTGVIDWEVTTFKVFTVTP